MKKYLKKTIEFYDKNVDEYIKNTIDLQDIDWLDKFSSYLSHGSKVLDIGCAYGRDSKYFVKNGFETYGIDLSKKMIEKAKMFEPNAEYFAMDMLDLDFQDSFFEPIQPFENFHPKQRKKHLDPSIYNYNTQIHTLNLKFSYSSHLRLIQRKMAPLKYCLKHPWRILI